MKTFITPIDFSEGTEHVIAQASTLVRAFGGRLVLLHVIAPLPAAASEFDPPVISVQLNRDVAWETDDRLARLQARLRAQGITTTSRHVTGNPGPEILAQARELGADYIVMGSHGHGSIYDLIVGSTTSRVLRDGTCPVIVVPLGAIDSGAKIAAVHSVDHTRAGKHPVADAGSHRDAS